MCKRRLTFGLDGDVFNLCLTSTRHRTQVTNTTYLSFPRISIGFLSTSQLFLNWAAGQSLKLDRQYSTYCEAEMYSHFYVALHCPLLMLTVDMDLQVFTVSMTFVGNGRSKTAFV